MMEKEKISFIRAKTMKDGTKIYMHKLEDYNRMRDKLRKENTEHVPVIPNKNLATTEDAEH